MSTDTSNADTSNGDGRSLWDLSFGALAHRSTLINQEQLEHAWAERGDGEATTLGDVLVDHGWLRPEDKRYIDRLLEQRTEQNGGDARAGLEQLTEAWVLPDSMTGLGTQVGADRRGDGGRHGGRVPGTAGRRERYVRRRLHAPGGMGEIWVAWDNVLGHEVAWKELLPERAMSLSARRRLLKEAYITSLLQHPGIAPVYDLSTPDVDQSPYYTMRFVPGKTLSEAVAEYHERRRAGVGKPLELRELLGAFVSICQTIAFAHSKGVMHRDLKGQNIKIGEFGEVIVLDWGLAKFLDDETPPIPADGLAGEDEGDALPEASRPGDGLTYPGDVLGTAAYMAPEQAQGRLEDVGRRTDVYGLGAVLYEILTGEAPFKGANRTAILEQVVNTPPVSPRILVPTVSPALDAVCLKCLKKAPGDRYASASALADEIRHNLADEPVEAYPEPRRVRVRRWVGRHRTLAAASAAGVLVLALSLGPAAVFLNMASLREMKARGHLGVAQHAVDRFFTRISQDVRLKAFAFERLRRALLTDAAEFSQEFVRLEANEPGVEEELGKIHIHLARINEELGDFTTAVVNGKQGLSIYERLPADPIDKPRPLLGTAEALRSLGESHWGLQDHDEARRRFEQAAAILVRLGRAHPKDPEYDFLLASTLNRLGKLMTKSLGDGPGGERVLIRSREICGRLAAKYPGSPKYAKEFAEASVLLGSATVGRDFEGASGLFDFAWATRARLAESERDDPHFLSDQVDTGMHIATAYSNARRLDRVEPLCVELEALSKRLSDEHPDVVDYAVNHSLIELLRAIQTALIGDHAGAVRAARSVAAREIDRPTQTGIVLLFAACALALSSEEALSDPALDPPDRETTAEAYQQEAVGLLEECRRIGTGKGPDVKATIETDPDLKSLRKRKDYEALMRAFKEEAKAAGRSTGP